MVLKADAGILKEKVAKVAFCIGDAVKVQVNGKQKNQEGKSQVTLITCNGNAQAMASFYGEFDGDAANVILGSEFLSVINTMSKLNGKITVRFLENAAKVSCKNSEVFVGMKESFNMLPVEKNKDTIMARIDKKNFVKAITLGGYASSVDDSKGMKNMVGLYIYPDCKLKTYSSDFYQTAFSETDFISVAKQGKDGKPCAIDKKLVYGLDCAKMNEMAKLLPASDTVNVIINKTNMVFNCGTEFYIFRAFSRLYPEMLEEVCGKRELIAKFKFKTSSFMTACDLVSLVSDSQKPVILSLVDGKLEISEMGRKSVSVIEDAEIEGSFEKVGFKLSLLKNGVNHLASDTFEMHIQGAKQLIFIEGKDEHAHFCMTPIDLNSIS